MSNLNNQCDQWSQVWTRYSLPHLAVQRPRMKPKAQSAMYVMVYLSPLHWSSPSHDTLINHYANTGFVKGALNWWPHSSLPHVTTRTVLTWSASTGNAEWQTTMFWSVKIASNKHLYHSAVSLKKIACTSLVLSDKLFFLV